MRSLAEIRKEKKVSQQELANFVGVSQETISQYETGSRTPSVTRARKIASFFSLALDDIFFGADISKLNIT